MSSVNPYIVDLVGASESGEQEIASDLDQLSRVISEFKRKVAKAARLYLNNIMPSLMGREWEDVNSKLTLMQDFKLLKLKLRFESNKLTQRMLYKGLQLLNDLTAVDSGDRTLSLDLGPCGTKAGRQSLACPVVSLSSPCVMFACFGVKRCAFE